MLSDSLETIAALLSGSLHFQLWCEVDVGDETAARRNIHLIAPRAIGSYPRPTAVPWPIVTINTGRIRRDLKASGPIALYNHSQQIIIQIEDVIAEADRNESEDPVLGLLNVLGQVVTDLETASQTDESGGLQILSIDIDPPKRLEHSAFNGSPGDYLSIGLILTVGFR